MADEPSQEQKEWEEFIDLIKENHREHAGYFSWQTDRAIEEYGVVQAFMESLERRDEVFFHTFSSREPGKDPPDCEALNMRGNRIGIEVTELVDGDSIAATKHGGEIPWEPWTIEELRERIETTIRKKDTPTKVHGGPYEEYVLIIYTDEPRLLDYDLIESVKNMEFGPVRLLDRAFLMMSYLPQYESCPYIEINLRR